MASTTNSVVSHDHHELPPLCEKIPIKNNPNKAINLTTLLLLFSILLYRLLHLSEHGYPWLLAFLCESWFTFDFFLILNTKWTPVDFKTHPQTLLQRMGTELPAVDAFVTTADVAMEPPIMTANTVLSLLAVDYPAHKLACYVSDDGCSPLTLFSLIHAFEFARIWVPFCKKYGIQVRAPFRYFSIDIDDSVSPPDSDDSRERDSGGNFDQFQLEWKNMKEEYEKLKQKIEKAVNGAVPFECSGEYADFAYADKNDHSSIIKVIWENKENHPDSLPHLVYVSREKRPTTPHHYKAGAMNVLTRVSGVMTNAPFMLNVDCDMFVNNPNIILHAMCSFLGLNPQDCAFVQFPQVFYNELKDDPFGNQMVVGFEIVGRGMAGIQGPLYAGTGCFHRRKVIYNFCLDNADNKVNEDETFGNSKELMESVAKTFTEPVDGKNIDTIITSQDLSTMVQAAHQVARCDYEDGTTWGSKVGWKYGSMTEDLLTGMQIHAMGLKSVSCMPNPPGFLGIVPTSGPISMSQVKRWITGLLQILFSKNSPIFATLHAKLQFRQCLTYIWILIWGLRSIPTLCYAILPAYCIITNSSYLPKAHEPAMVLFLAQFVIENIENLSYFRRCGQSFRAWWNNLRMTKINAATSMLFGVVGFPLKLLGVSEIVFEVTQKESDESSTSSTKGTENFKGNDAANAGRFTFDESPMFVPPTTLLFVEVAALGLSLWEGGRDEVGLGEYLASVWVVMCFWPFVRGLFGKGKYGISLSTLLKSSCFSFIFIQLCRQASVHGW
ncbi:cellulose synthase-like protein H1 isoform X2 [Humulus lupulus]|uniref:cellulose synthase-like protein H1 isoform X2 n=1 Tax=Humulus lupulus TaxID=3486 RepID=UPI002B40B256|nr:cellulose synthase-like protein H1 isoform X2 [Humulus lupulus]